MRSEIPSRRAGETVTISHNGFRYHITLGPDPKAPLEVFLSGPRAGSDLAHVSHDAAIILSIALQHGVPRSAFKKSISRNADGEPHTILGVLCDLLGEGST